MSDPTDDEFTELVDARFGRVDLVGKAANGLSFLIAKSAHPQSAPTPADVFGPPKKAPMSETTTVVKADDIDLDPTVVLADPIQTDAPGNPDAPGSPAWEAIDAATAMKWTAIASRLKNAILTLSDREAQEVAVGDDEDITSVWDLQDAADAVDYAISLLAPFAAGEATEAELGTEELAAVGKALAVFDAAPLEVIEGYAPVLKAGRVLSASNETSIREAVTKLQGVLDSLPAPVDQPVTKTKENTVSETSTDEAAPADVTKAEQDVVKADEAKATMQGVYDADGNLVGVCDPADITPLVPAASTDDGDDDSGDDADMASDDTAPVTDTTPADPATVGTPADATADDVTKESAPATEDVTKSTDERVEELIAKSTQQGEEIAVLKAEIERLGSPAPSRVITNGQGVPKHLLRGQDRDDSGVTPLAKSGEELRAALADAQTAPERDAIAKEMNELGVTALAALHAGQQ